MKLKEAAGKLENGIEETLDYCDFPGEHWTCISTGNAIERLNREICRRTRVVGSFLDGNFALMLVCAIWPTPKNMKHLEVFLENASAAGRLHVSRSLQTNLSKALDTTLARQDLFKFSQSSFILPS